MLIPVIFLICCLGALGFEVLRFRTRPEAWVRTELTILGFALTILTGFLGWRIFHSGRIPLSSPQDAILVLIWVLTGIAMGLISTWRRKSFGLGLLPMILLLLLAVFGADDTPYAARPASAVWGGFMAEACFWLRCPSFSDVFPACCFFGRPGHLSILHLLLPERGGFIRLWNGFTRPISIR